MFNSMQYIKNWGNFKVNSKNLLQKMFLIAGSIAAEGRGIQAVGAAVHFGKVAAQEAGTHTACCIGHNQIGRIP